MKKLSLFLTALFLAAAVKSQAQPDLIARIHFAGAQQISADANSKTFADEFCSPEARALESQTFDKLSRAPAAWYKYKLPAGAGDGTAQLRPLLDDFLKSEWVFEMRDTASGSPEYALAIHLRNDRAQLWQNNLASLLESWTKLPVEKISGGWELRKHLPPNVFQFQRSGDWVIIDCGENELRLGREILEPFLKTGPAGAETNWLTADLNWPRLAQIFPALAKFDFPKVQMQVVGRDGNLHLNGKLILSQPLAPPEKWRVPADTIHPPFISFTAARGFGLWLEKQNWAQRFEISPPLNQIFIWALPQIPFQTFAAVPVPDATAAFAQLDAKLSAPGRTPFIAPFKMAVTNDKISWQGVPFISPFVQALREKSGDFLLGGFFPNTPRAKPLPPELFAQLNTPNLVYYHWEITAERLPQLRNLSQLGLVLTRHKQLDAQSAAGKWLDRVGLKLGNTVTEITQTAPDELTFTRKAPGGLTAAELLALANWLDAPNFPGCDLRLPSRPAKFKRPRAAIPFVPPVAH